MKSFSLVGAGRVGTSLGKALSEIGYTLKSLSCATQREAEETRRIIGKGKPSTDNIDTAQNAELLFITVPDERIEPVVQELASSPLSWQNKTVFHCSGFLPSAVLQPLKTKRASTASLHPIQSIPSKETAPSVFQNIYFSLEGEKRAILLGQKIVHDLGSRSIQIKPEDKPCFHAALSISSNFLVVLIDSVLNLLKSAGLSETKAIQILRPLLNGTLRNISNNNVRTALTGPLIRGDRQTVYAHLEALKKFKDLEDLYRHLATMALDKIGKEKALPTKKIKELRRILEDR